MSRFSCPCGAVVEAEIPSEFLAAVNAHNCAYHSGSEEPETAHEAWAGVIRQAIFAALLIALFAICAWGSSR